MKRKRTAAILILAVLLFALTACSGEKDIVGKWELDIVNAMRMTGQPEDQVAQVQTMVGDALPTLEFTKDGRYIAEATVMGETQTMEMPYTLEGKMVLTDDTSFEYKVVGDELFLTEDGITFVLKRTK